MDTPRLEINLMKITNNTRTIVSLCENNGIGVVGVTKGVSGMPQVAKAMLDGGVCCLADARIQNIKKMRKAGIAAPIMMLRLPRIGNASQIAHLADISVNSERHMIRQLSHEGLKRNQPHNIILMIDVGDRREGVLFSRALESIDQILAFKGVQLMGIGTNVGCYGGVIPTEKNMGQLASIAIKIHKAFSLPLPVVSVGGTNCLKLIEDGKMPAEINQIRIGEGILLGRDSSTGRVLPGTEQDAFQLVAEIVEIKSKPSLPMGILGKDAFGHTPVFKNRGIRKRALIALGKQDVRLSGMIPVDAHIKILGGSSDYIVLDISDSAQNYRLGDSLRFHLLYPGLLSLTTSPYVSHVFTEDSP